MDNKIKVWLVNEGENLPGDDNNPRLQRMGLLAYEVEKLGAKVTWWQSTYNHYQKKFRCLEDKDVQLTENLELKMLHSCGYAKNVSVKRLFHEFGTARKFYKIALEEDKPDVIVVAMPTIALTHYAVKYAKKNNIPILIDLRDLNPDVFVSPFHGIIRTCVSIGIQPLRRMLGNATKAAFGLIGTTEPYLNWGLNYAKRVKNANDRVFFVSYPDGGKATALSENSRWKEFDGYNGVTCCFFGQFGRLVDFDTVIEAAAICKKKNIEARFLLCGKGELLEQYQQKVKDMGLDNVYLPGWVNKTDIADIGFISDAGLMAYKHDDNFNMQMPNKFSEYLSLGLAILLQPTGVMEDVIKNNECGLRYETPEQLYEVVKNLSEDKDQLKRMKDNSRKLFEEEFSVSKVYKEYGEYIIQTANKVKEFKS